MSNMKEILEMDEKKLQSEIAVKQADLALLRRNIATMRETKNHKIRSLKLEIARLNTALNKEKEK